MRKKTIALAIERFSRAGGGAESYAVSLAGALLAAGWEVHVFGFRWDGEPAGTIFHRIPRPRLVPAWVRMLWFAAGHRRFVRRHRFDVVLGFGNTVAMNAYQSHGGVHRLSTERKVWRRSSPAGRALERLVHALSIKHWVRHGIESAPFRFERLPAIVAISQLVLDDLVASFPVSAQQIRRIDHGVDLERFRPELRERERRPLRARLGVAESDVVFLFVAYHLEAKGIVPLVEAARQLAERGERGFRVVVVGGRSSRRLARRIDRLGLRETFTFAGAQRHPEAFYAAADVLVLPTYYDACSLVVFEAMACGLPAITTETNGAAGILSDGVDGLVIGHPPRPAELADAMRALLDPEARVRMSANAIETIRDYPVARSHGELIRLFDQVAEGPEVDAERKDGDRSGGRVVAE